MINKSLKTALDIVKSYRWNSILIKYWKNAMLIIVLPFMVITIIIFTYSYSNQNVKTVATLNESFNKTYFSVNGIFDTIDNQHLIFSSNNSVTMFVTSEDIYTNSYTANVALIRIRELMTNAMTTTQSINAIHIYNMKADYVFSSHASNTIEEFDDKLWYNHFVKTKETNFIIPNLNSENNTYDSISICYGLYKNSKITGILVFKININEFARMVLGENPNSYEDIYLVDNNGGIVFSTVSEHIHKEISAINILNSFFLEKETTGTKNNYLFFKKNELNNQKLSFIAMVDLKQLPSNSLNAVFVFLICLLIIIVIPLILSFYLSAQFYYNIAEIMMPFQPVDTSDEQHKDKFNELLFIQRRLSNTIMSKQNAEEELAKKMVLLKKSQTMALQMQLNPHFLFNTLNLVSLKVIDATKGENDASRSISLLSDLLNASLNTKEYIVSIDEEISYAKKYIEIESIRYNHNFDVIWNIDERALSYNTVKLILQPVLENAFEHGIRKQGGNHHGLITISTAITDTTIIFSIANSGCPISSEKLEEIQNRLQTDDIPETNNIGLCNVNQRIKLIFGEQYGCSIFSDTNGTTVTITIPKENSL